MSEIKIKFSIDLSDQKSMMAVARMFAGLNGSVTIPSPDSTPDEPKTPAPVEDPVPDKTEKKPRKTRTPKEEPATLPEEPAPEEEKPEQEEDNRGLKIEDVRLLLAQKVNDHRDAVKSKLTALGANNVSSLDASKYGEFVDFLNGLK